MSRGSSSFLSRWILCGLALHLVWVEMPVEAAMCVAAPMQPSALFSEHAIPAEHGYYRTALSLFNSRFVHFVSTDLETAPGAAHASRDWPKWLMHWMKSTANPYEDVSLAVWRTLQANTETLPTPLAHTVLTLGDMLHYIFSPLYRPWLFGKGDIQESVGYLFSWATLFRLRQTSDELSVYTYMRLNTVRAWVEQHGFETAEIVRKGDTSFLPVSFWLDDGHEIRFDIEIINHRVDEDDEPEGINLLLGRSRQETRFAVLLQQRLFEPSDGEDDSFETVLEHELREATLRALNYSLESSHQRSNEDQATGVSFDTYRSEPFRFETPTETSPGASANNDVGGRMLFPADSRYGSYAVRRLPFAITDANKAARVYVHMNRAVLFRGVTFSQLEGLVYYKPESVDAILVEYFLKWDSKQRWIHQRLKDKRMDTLKGLTYAYKHRQLHMYDMNPHTRFVLYKTMNEHGVINYIAMPEDQFLRTFVLDAQMLQKPANAGVPEHDFVREAVLKTLAHTYNAAGRVLTPKDFLEALSRWNKKHKRRALDIGVRFLEHDRWAEMRNMATRMIWIFHHWLTPEELLICVAKETINVFGDPDLPVAETIVPNMLMFGETALRLVGVEKMVELLPKKAAVRLFFEHLRMEMQSSKVQYWQPFPGSHLPTYDGIRETVLEGEGNWYRSNRPMIQTYLTGTFLLKALSLHISSRGRTRANFVRYLFPLETQSPVLAAA